jgi:hypothetical protein
MRLQNLAVSLFFRYSLRGATRREEQARKDEQDGYCQTAILKPGIETRARLRREIPMSVNLGIGITRFQLPE